VLGAAPSPLELPHSRHGYRRVCKEEHAVIDVIKTLTSQGCSRVDALALAVARGHQFARTLMIELARRGLHLSLPAAQGWLSEDASPTSLASLRGSCAGY